MSERALLTTGGRLFFLDKGYLSLERLVEVDELERLREVYDSVIDRLRRGEPETPCKDSIVSPGLVWVHTPELCRPELLWTRLYSEAMAIASALLDVPASRIGASFRFFYKPPLIGRQVPWHQDEAYKHPGYHTSGVSVWVPLDEASAESGCMQFIPESHKGDVRVHRQITFDPTGGLGLTTDDVDPRQAVACALAAGGATLHHCRTLHHTGPNTTGRARRALVVVCEAPAVRREVPAERPWQTWAGRPWFS